MSTKLNILTTCLRYPPAPGGAEVLIEQLIQGLSSRGHNLKIYTSDLFRHNLPAKWLTKEQTSRDPEYLHRLSSFYFGAFPYPIFRGLIRNSLKEKNIDLVHGHNFYYYSADSGRMISYLKNVPFVFSPYFYIESREAKKWRIYRQTFGRLTMAADCVIALSPFEKNLITKYYKPKRIEIIPPGINEGLRDKVDFNVYEQYGHQDKNIILSVGRICYGKGINITIQALSMVVKKYPNTILAITGSDFGDKADFLKLAKKLNVADKILWLGEIKEPILSSAYQYATIFCLPTNYEAFGIVFAEAMANGLPIVATDFSAVPYVVPKDKAGFLVPRNDPKATANALGKLIENRELAHEMGEFGREEALKYSWKKMTEKVEEVYYGLV